MTKTSLTLQCSCACAAHMTSRQTTLPTCRARLPASLDGQRCQNCLVLHAECALSCRNPERHRQGICDL